MSMNIKQNIFNTAITLRTFIQSPVIKRQTVSIKSQNDNKLLQSGKSLIVFLMSSDSCIKRQTVNIIHRPHKTKGCEKQCKQKIMFCNIMSYASGELIILAVDVILQTVYSSWDLIFFLFNAIFSVEASHNSIQLTGQILGVGTWLQKCINTVYGTWTYYV